MIADSSLIPLPFLLAILAAIVTYFIPGQRIIARCFLLLHNICSIALAYTVCTKGPIATAAGAWLAPYGIVLVVDAFAALMLALSSIIFTCCLMEVEAKRAPFYWPLLFLLQAGISLSFTTGDLFNLFVAFELMLMSSYAILTTQGAPSRLNNAYSYLAMNVTASFIYLIAIALFYSYTGELNFASLAQHLNASESTIKWIPMLVLLLVMAVKGGLFPLYFWLPDAYPILPSRLAGLFSGILSKVGIYVFYRLLVTVFPQNETLNFVLTILACLTMFFGVLGAVSRVSIPGILSYHTLSQVGYIVLALSLATPLAIAAGIFFILHNMVVKCSLFLIGGVADRYCGSSRLALMGGLWASVPFLGILFLLQAFSLAGLPPFSGFWGKYLLFFEGLALEAYAAIAIAVITSFFTLLSMVKIWNTAFIGPPKEYAAPSSLTGIWGAIVLTLIALCMGLFPQQTFSLSNLATEQLMDRDQYITVSLAAGHKG